MKKTWIISTAVSCLAAAVLFTACSEQASCCPPKAEQTNQPKPMHPVAAQLDLDGDFFMYMNTSTVEKRITDYVDTLASIVKTSGDVADVKQIEDVATKVKEALKWSGLLSIDSFSLSTKETEDELSRVIAIAEYDEADAQKALWRIMASEPKVLKGIQYAPADAVYTLNSTTSLDELWKVLNKALETYFPAEATEEVNGQLAMIEMLLGSSVNDLLGSLDAEILISIQFSKTRQSTFPIGTEPLVIPEPSLIIGLQTKEPAVSQLILTKLKEAAVPLVESKHGDYTLNTLNLPIPMPCPVAPTLVQTEDYLLIGSCLEVITQALDSQANQNGLVSTPLYKKLLADAPEKTSGIEFLSPRMVQTYMDGFMDVIGDEAGTEGLALIDMMLERYKLIQSGSYVLKTQNGIYSHSLGNYGSANPGEVIASAGVGYVGLMAAIGIPSFHKARNNSIEKSCINNMRILDASKEMWAMDNNKVDGDAVTGADISEYIKNGFSAMECPAGGTYTLGTVGTKPECAIHGSY